MPRKGVVVVPLGTPCGRAGEGAAGVQRVANRPIICHVLDGLLEAGATELAIVAEGERLAEIRASVDDDDVSLGTNITYLAQNGRGHLLGGLAAAAEFVGSEPCLAHTADGLLAQPLAPLVELFEQDQADLLLLFHRNSNGSDRSSVAMQRLLGIVELDGSRSRLGVAGVCMLGPGVIDRACTGTSDSDPELDLITVAERIARGDGRLQVAHVRGWRRYRGNPLDLLELNRIVLDQLTAGAEPMDNGDHNHIEGRVVIHPTAEVTDSVLVGPCIIGADARIASAYIGPYTSIGAGARVEGAEIERSIISEEARIMHVSGRIDASTVGPRAAIFRDFGLPRAMRLHVGEGVEVALN